MEACGPDLGGARAGAGCVLLFEGAERDRKVGADVRDPALAAQTGMQVLMGSGRRREARFSLGVMVQLLEYVLAHVGQQPPPAPDSLAARFFAPRNGDELQTCRSTRSTVCTRCVAELARRPHCCSSSTTPTSPTSKSEMPAVPHGTVEQLPVAVLLAAGSVAASRAPEPLSDIARHQSHDALQLQPLSARGTIACACEALADSSAEKRPPRRYTRRAEAARFIVNALAATLSCRAGRARSHQPAGARAAAPGVHCRVGPGSRCTRWTRARLPCSPPIAVLGPCCELRHASPWRIST